MFSKKLLPIPAVALLLLVAALMATGASQSQGIKIAPANIVESPNARVNAGSLPSAIPDAPAPPPGGSERAQVVWSDDFAAGNLDKWQNPSISSATWEAKGGRLLQRGDASGETTDDSAVLVAKNVNFDNGAVAVQFYPKSSEPVGVAFRGSGVGYYRVSLYRDLSKLSDNSSKARLEIVTPNGKVREIASAPVSAWPGFQSRWYDLRVDAVGSHISVSVDGAQIISADDSTLSVGWAGVWTVADQGKQFDNALIERATQSR